ncbi:YhcN/YlaJ family sporulation lipoprotein [Bacillus marasmi]|uniref:YhcN/YlaJ family sporulation lipoprotein n=1 Tax=Bacillus marasmi TaxID=1926279 RepID=UPI00164EA76A|nr:YhcN/YlaJ family sporulation lipoprotein [Bacillus marasmi]
MNKKRFLIPVIGFLSIGLAGCGNDESAVQDRNTKRVQPFGYYSNENHNNGGNVQILDENDNDGPLTEIMDHSLGTEGATGRNGRGQYLDEKDENGNPKNPTRPLANSDRNFFERDNRFSRSDANYHGHLDGNRASTLRSTVDNNRDGIYGSNNNNVITGDGANNNIYGTNNVRYNRKTDGNQTRIMGTPNPANNVSLTNQLNKTVGAVENVKKVQSIVNNNQVVIAVDLANYHNAAKTRQKIEQAVKGYTNGRTITIVTDQGSFQRVRSMTERNGYRDEYDQDLRNILKSNNFNQAR